jgi:hypothetical protein
MSRIIYVNVLGGPPFEYVLAKLKNWGQVFVVQPEIINDVEKAQLLSLVDDVCFLYEINTITDLSNFLVEYANKINADAVLTFDEFYLYEVTQANLILGFRGAGSNVLKSIDKLQMYQILNNHNLLQRKYLSFSDISELKTSEITTPFVVKPSSAAGSLGIFLVSENIINSDFANKFQSAKESVVNVVEKMPFKEFLKAQKFIQEELLHGDTETWFGKDTIYADYISVEGVIINSKYYPIAITQNYPMLHPFIETVSLTPSTIPLNLQLEIVNSLVNGLEAFGLEYCGVHTEIKLLKNQKIAIIETAARFAGWSIIPQIEAVFNVDPIGEFVQSLINPSYKWEKNFTEIYESKKGGAATINLIPASEFGQPWSEKVQYKKHPPFDSIIHEKSYYKFANYVDIEDFIEPFCPYDGSWNSFGQVFLNSPNVDILNADIQKIRSYLKQLIQ